MRLAKAVLLAIVALFFLEGAFADCANPSYCAQIQNYFVKDMADNVMDSTHPLVQAASGDTKFRVEFDITNPGTTDIQNLQAFIIPAGPGVYSGINEDRYIATGIDLDAGQTRHFSREFTMLPSSPPGEYNVRLYLRDYGSADMDGKNYSMAYQKINPNDFEAGGISHSITGETKTGHTYTITGRYYNHNPVQVLRARITLVGAWNCPTLEEDVDIPAGGFVERSRTCTVPADASGRVYHSMYLVGRQYNNYITAYYPGYSVGRVITYTQIHSDQKIYTPGQTVKISGNYNTLASAEDISNATLTITVTQTNGPAAEQWQESKQITGLNLPKGQIFPFNDLEFTYTSPDPTKWLQTFEISARLDDAIGRVTVYWGGERIVYDVPPKTDCYVYSQSGCACNIQSNTPTLGKATITCGFPGAADESRLLRFHFDTKNLISFKKEPDMPIPMIVTDQYIETVGNTATDSFKLIINEEPKKQGDIIAMPNAQAITDISGGTTQVGIIGRDYSTAGPPQTPVSVDLVDATTNQVVQSLGVIPMSFGGGMGSASGTIDISGIVSSGTLAEGKNYYVKLSVPAAAGETYTANNERKFLVVSPKKVSSVNVDETNVLLLPLVFLTVLGLILFRK